MEDLASHMKVLDKLGFEIETSELKLFDFGIIELENFFMNHHRPLNIYLQYLYGSMLAQRHNISSLEKYIESVFHSEISLMLKCKLSQLSPKFILISKTLWKDLEKEYFLNPLLQAEQLFLLACHHEANANFTKAIDYYSKAQALFDQFNLFRRSLICECAICDLNKKLNPSFDAHTAWADIVFEARKIGDRSIYMSALSKLSFSL